MSGHLRKEESFSFNRPVLDYIQHAAEHGLYEIRGLGAKRALPTFDDLVFLTASASRYPLEGYREKCIAKTVLGTRHAKKPIELVIGQGANPGGGGMLLGQKISARVAAMRTLPEGIDQRSACRHPDWTGPDDLTIKILELREITDWQVPVYVKMGATRVREDVKLAVKAGADVVVIDGMQGGTAATQQTFIEHSGIPTLAALPLAVEALDEMNVLGEVQLIISGGIRSGADVAKALALGADAVAIGQGILMALGCNSEHYHQNGAAIDATADYAKLETAPGYCHHCHTGRCPVGITT